MDIREQCEVAFEKLGKALIRRRWTAIALMTLLTLVLGAGMGRLQVETSAETYLAKKDPARRMYDLFRDDVFLIAIRSKNIFSAPFLNHLSDYHQAIEERLPFLDEVNSLVNARVTRGNDQELIVEDLLEQMPKTDEEFAQLRARVLANPLYKNILISEDGQTTALVVKILPGMGAGTEDPLEDAFADEGALAEGEPDYPHATTLSPEELAETMEVMMALEEEFAREDFEIFVTGDPQVTYALMQVMAEEMQMFLVVTMAVIALVLLVFFRRISGVVLPMLVVFLPISATLGLMGWVGLPITLSTQSMPTFLFAVCVGDAVHIISNFYQQLDSGASRDDAITYALRHSGLAVLMTSLTTAGALGTFAFSNLMPIAGLGFAAPAGVMLAFLYSTCLLPALLAVLPIRPKKHRKGDAEDNDPALTRLLVRLGDYCTEHAWLVTCLWMALVLAAFYGGAQMRVSHQPIKWFPEGHATRVAAEVADADLKGSMSLELVIDTREENGLFDPDAMQRIDALQEFVKTYRTDKLQAAHAISVVEILKETNQALHGNDPAFYSIPEDRELIAQELLLFESSGSDDLEEMVDSSFRYARIHVPLRFEDGLYYIPYVEGLREKGNEIIGEDLDMTITGLIMLYMRSFHVMINTTVESYTLALLMIIPLMVLIIGDLRLGLISIIPNLAAGVAQIVRRIAHQKRLMSCPALRWRAGI
ncbi:MAG: MMPL family transporter [Deltaproteobacteria bacterium]|nr:MMPL family transporter [Deltaproteobacteria bacterium]